MSMLAGLIDWTALAQVALISACAGIGIALALGLAARSSLRAQAERANGNAAVASVLSAVTLLCVLVVLGAIATGLYLIAAK